MLSCIMDKQVEAESQLFFITDGQECYVKIKNAITNNHIALKNNELICDDICDNFIFAIKPNIYTGNFTISPINFMEHCHGTQYNYYVISNKDVSKMMCVCEMNVKEQEDKLFLLEKINNKLYIYSTHITPNRYGETGRYLYESGEHEILCDGDKSILTSEWIIEKVNTNIQINDIRSDYETLNKDLLLDTKISIKKIFPTPFKFFLIKKTHCDKYLDVSVGHDYTSQNFLVGSNNSTGFAIRPIIGTTKIYISYQFSDLMNVYALPNDPHVYLGAPDCLIAQFYLIQYKGHIVFRTCLNEIDEYGNYGKYLNMIKTGDKYVVTFGSCDDNATFDITPQ